MFYFSWPVEPAMFVSTAAETPLHSDTTTTTHAHILIAHHILAYTHVTQL